MTLALIWLAFMAAEFTLYARAKVAQSPETTTADPHEAAAE